MTDDNIQKRISKLMAHVIKGEGHERENAERALRALCNKHEIIYDDLFRRENKRRFEVKVPDATERIIFRQMCSKYGEIEDFWQYRRDRRIMIFETFPHVYLELMGMWPIFQKAYRKEKRKMMLALPKAFVAKHNLYGRPPDDYKVPEWTEEEIEAFRLARRMAGDMDDVTIRKQLNKPQ